MLLGVKPDLCHIRFSDGSKMAAKEFNGHHQY
jgi:hypothetical protein